MGSQGHHCQCTGSSSTVSLVINLIFAQNLQMAWLIPLPIGLFFVQFGDPTHLIYLFLEFFLRISINRFSFCCLCPPLSLFNKNIILAINFFLKKRLEIIQSRGLSL
ncbi:hypothetical protein ACB092_10G114400 [Castanea dentata]